MTHSQNKEDQLPNTEQVSNDDAMDAEKNTQQVSNDNTVDAENTERDDAMDAEHAKQVSNNNAVDAENTERDDAMDAEHAKQVSNDDAMDAENAEQVSNDNAVNAESSPEQGGPSSTSAIPRTDSQGDEERDNSQSLRRSDRIRTPAVGEASIETAEKTKSGQKRKRKRKFVSETETTTQETTTHSIKRRAPNEDKNTDWDQVDLTGIWKPLRRGYDAVEFGTLWQTRDPRAYDLPREYDIELKLEGSNLTVSLRIIK